MASRAEALSTLYLASQLAQLGLEPLGDNGSYYQKVPLVGVASDTPADAEAVFAGPGIVAPELNWNGYQGVKGRGPSCSPTSRPPPIPNSSAGRPSPTMAVT